MLKGALFVLAPVSSDRVIKGSLLRHRRSRVRTPYPASDWNTLASNPPISN